jgi:uncharacterized protein
MELQHAGLIAAMIAYDKGDPMRIQHFIKVHDFAAVIGRLENVDKDTLFVLETVAIVHDIGIHISEQKYGRCDGKLQEQEGPREAESLLTRVGGYTDEQIARVCWLVGHHHTYSNIDGIDYQILIEADFLVNIYEDKIEKSAVASVRQKIFKTKSGIAFLDAMFD